MKKLLISKCGLLALLIGFSFFSANAQITSLINSTPAVPAPGGVFVAGATNTGVSAVDIGGLPAIASVCDGLIPRINVIHGANNFTQPIGVGGGISNPDITVIPSSFAGTVAYYIVAYEQGGAIIAQDWTYDAWGGGSLTPGITVTICSGGCTSPNVDAVNDCGIGFVYEKSGKIKGRFGSLGALCPTASAPSNLNAEVTFSDCTPGGNDDPDISLFHDGTNTMTNVVYTHNSGSTKSLVLQRHLIVDFINATPVLCANNFILETVPFPAEDLQDPRIASVSGDISHDSRDCQIVVAHTDATLPVFEEIWGYTHRWNTYGPNQYTLAPRDLCVSPLSIQYCYNRKPVVAFTNCNRYMVEWEYEASGVAGSCLPGLAPGTQHILTKKLDLSGNFIGTDYALSNYNTTTTAMAPSVCGRYVLNLPFGIESVHINPTFGQMLVKSTDCNLADVAKQAADAGTLPGASSTDDSNFKAYPNPFENSLSFEFEIESNVDSYRLEILDIHGRLVDSFDQTDLKLGLNQIQWNAAEQVAGTYFIRLTSSKGVTMHKVIKIGARF